jgi:choline dehydrogenase-like flavoprotein
MVRDAADAVIVGAGPAGLTFALRLAQAGKRVIVVEAGPAWKRTDLISSQIWARRLKWGGPPVPTSGEHARGLLYTMGWGLGGAALHHYGLWPRLHPIDFTLASDHGVGADWPFGYDTLRPWYDRVQQAVGLSGDTAGEVWRPPADPYPQPPSPRFAQGEILARGFERLGRPTSASPAAILVNAMGTREGCLQDGWCDAGCPTGALFNPLVTMVPQAQRAGVRFLTDTQALRVFTDPAGRRATGLLVANAAGQRTIEAPVVILAASAIQTPRLLLASADGGLANRNGRVGKSFFMHAFSTAFGLFEEPTDVMMGHTAGQVFTQDRYAKTRPEPGAFGSSTWSAAAASRPNDLIGVAMTRPDLFGPELHAFMARASQHLAQMTSVNETIPLPVNHVRLTSARDPFGMPLAHVHHTLDPRSLALWQAVLAEGLEVMRAAGAQEAWPGPMVTSHFMGGTVMGTDPATSVTDGWGRTHELPNLFIAGSGLFPSGGAVNPTFTLLALAERSAAMLVDQWGADDA